MESSLTTMIDQVSTWTGANTWAGKAFIVICLALTFDLVQRIFLKRLSKKLEQTENPWDDALLHAIQRPLTLLIWVIGLTLAADIAGAQSGATVFEIVEPVRTVGIIVSLTWFLVRMISNIQPERSLDFFIYAITRITNRTKYHEVKQDVLLKINEIIIGHGADIAFPTTTLDMPEAAFARN